MAINEGNEAVQIETVVETKVSDNVKAEPVAPKKVNSWDALQAKVDFMKADNKAFNERVDAAIKAKADVIPKRPAGEVIKGFFARYFMEVEIQSRKAYARDYAKNPPKKPKTAKVMLNGKEVELPIAA